LLLARIIALLSFAASSLVVDYFFFFFGLCIVAICYFLSPLLG
jgi:hypothetical protein